MKISVRDVRFSYSRGIEALSGVSLEMQEGERIAVVGSNGSGKTTLAKHLNGLLIPTSGEVEIGGWNTRQRTVAQLSRRVGYVFQNPDEQIFKNNVAEEVGFGLRCLHVPEREIQARVDAALERTGLQGLRGAHPYELLPSQRKWVAIASVLVTDTPILVLDEPGTGQDVRGLARLGALVEDLASHGKTIMTITHDMDWCAEHCSRIVVMDQGKVQADGEPHRVFAGTDLLAAAFLEPPQVTQIGLALGLPSVVTTTDELLAKLLSNEQGVLKSDEH